jgi:YidC/Oxa1 family membrane protein insertase
MDKNQATGLVLIFGILFLYFTFFAPEPEKLPQTAKVKTETSANSKTANEVPQALESLKKAGIPDSALVIDTVPVWAENKDIRVKFSPLGARIIGVELRNFKTWDQKALHLVDANRSSQSLEIPINGKLINLSQLPFSSGKQDVSITDTGITIHFTCALPSGVSIIQRYQLGEKGFLVKSLTSINGATISKNSSAKLQWMLDANQLEKDLSQNRTTTCINYYGKEDGFNNLSETSLSEEKIELAKPVEWITFKQKFFNVGILSPSGFTKVVLRQKTDETDSQSVKKMEAVIEIPVENQGVAFNYYFGPNQFKTLKKVATDYDKNVYLGWPGINLVNRFITVNVFDWLQGVVSSYGIIIIILVLLIKLLLLPLSYKSYISMAKMKVLKPELDAIKEKTGDDMQKAQQEQMKLYQQVGINPLSGCIPLLLQMPILLAVFNFFPNAIELRQQSFLWAPDLSSYDSIATLPFSLPGYGNHVSLFTILMTISTLVLTWYNNQTTTVAGPMQSMSYIMPVVFMFILNSLPAGLSFYYLISNIVSIVQQQVIKRFVNEEKLRSKLEANKVKNANKKKTGFAARLEEAMRVAQEAQKDKEKGKKGK